MILVTSKTSDGNMDFRFGKHKEVLENRQKFFKKMRINSKTVAEVEQVHDNKVLVVDNILDPNTGADGLITNKAGLRLMLKLADCMAIGFYDPKHRAIGLVHAGRGGLEKGVIKNAINNLKQKFNTNPKDLKVSINPSIGPCHYRMDIWKEAENQLRKVGILPKNINNPKICTYENKDYFSHKRSENRNQPEGRFVTILGLK